MKNGFDIHQFYVKTCKKRFSHPGTVNDFLKGFVKEPFFKDFGILEKVNTKFQTRGFKEFRSDLFRKTRFKKSDCFVFLLFEFQSLND
jgi:hypothetical protein